MYVIHTLFARATAITRTLAATFALCTLIACAAHAATYYVAPTGSNALSTNEASPGSLSYAASNAPSGAIVVLANGTYDVAPNGFIISVSGVTFRAKKWHGATVDNSTGSGLVGPASNAVTDNVCQGIVFGPSTGLGWSGGGGNDWQFLDCVFTQNGGVGGGNNCLFERCVFTDDYSNSFDFAGSNQTVKDCIARRGNRSSADDDSVGDKEDFTTNFKANDLISYDNSCPSLWFDTGNEDWLVENSTFFANHGANNWYYMSINSGSSTTTFNASGQDGAGFFVGQPIMGIAGTAANIGAQTFVTKINGSTITVSPALPAIPQDGDQFAAQQDSLSSGDGCITEANDNGTFNNNWVYSNTDNGYFDHSSGGTTYGGTGGLTITNNLFAYNGEGFFVWSDARDQGPAKLDYNSFLFTPGSSNAFDSWGSTPGTYPVDAGIVFDYNDYDATNAQGNWAFWFSKPVVAGGLTAGSQPTGEEVVNGTEVYQDYLQNPATWDQDQHGNTKTIPFRSSVVASYYWPLASDTNWSDVYFPNNKFGLSDSIHQVDDTDGAVDNTIDAALAGHKVGTVLTIPVSAHTTITAGVGEVYDLNGRWVKLTVLPADLNELKNAVPKYVTCTTGNATQTYNIKVTLDSIPPYNVSATYNPSGKAAPAAPTLNPPTAGDRQVSLTWTASAGAESYSVFRSTTSGSGYKVAAARITTTSYTDIDLTNGTTYYYVVTASGYGISPDSNQESATPVGSNAYTGSMSLSDTAVTTDSIYELTTLGTADWDHWNENGRNQMATSKGKAVNEISDAIQLNPGGTATYGSYGPYPDRNVSWSNGVSPNTSGTDDQWSYWCNGITGQGWTITAPAGTTQHTLYIFCGGSSAGVTFEINGHLSDDTGHTVDQTNTEVTNSSTYTYLFTFTYTAENPNSTITITLTKDDANGSQSVDLDSAWLQ
jgi:hypothetical protein